MRVTVFIAASLTLVPTMASASETITYSYDAKGRLTNVAHSGGREDGETSTYAFDAADNRRTTQTTGARGQVIVVPLSGLQVIPIN